MINAIISGIFKLVQWIIAIELSPIDLLLSGVPFLAEAANGIQAFRSYLVNGLVWILDVVQVPAFKTVITAWILTWIFFANTQFAVQSIKLAFKWLQKLKFW